MSLVYRLDLTVDLFAFIIDGTAVLLGQAELDAIHDELQAQGTCWTNQDPEQMWSAVVKVLGRDPRL